MATSENDSKPNPWLNSCTTKEPSFKKKKVARYFDRTTGENLGVAKYDAKSEYPIESGKEDIKQSKEVCFIANLKTSSRWKGGLARLSVKKEKYPGRAPIEKDKLFRHSRGDGMDVSGVRTKFHTRKLRKREKLIEATIEQAARAELLLAEEGGFLESDVCEVTRQFTQKQIAAAVDITSATKHFDLQLSQFGPYRMDYNRSGRYLLLGGRKGHVAAIDWFTKQLFCEMNVMEEVFDIKWLHVETMFAVAQKNWVYVYDNQGTELHCIKQLNGVLKMEFLPYHFLLSTSSECGYLSWLDISIGKIVSQFNTRQGRLNVMTQNPANATLCLGHAKGTVTMWSPNVREPLAQMLCHNRPVQAVTVDHHGQYMATASANRSVKIWDLRMFRGHVQEYVMRSSATSLAFSQRRLLGVAMGNVVEVYRDCITQTANHCYLRHKMVKSVNNFQFCPYEDVLGVGHSGGFTSLIVPGAGEPNFDGLESNPYQTKSQRKEAEVKALLEKIQPEFIALDPSAIAEVDLPSVKEKMEAQMKQLHYNPPKLDLEHRKSKGKKGSAQKAKAKHIVREETKRKFVATAKEVQTEIVASAEASTTSIPVGVLDRFKPKKLQKK